MTEKNKIVIDPLLMKLLCCPSCKGDSRLEMNETGDSLCCCQCKKSYSVKKVDGPDGQGKLIPDLILRDS